MALPLIPLISAIIPLAPAVIKFVILIIGLLIILISLMFSNSVGKFIMLALGIFFCYSALSPDPPQQKNTYSTLTNDIINRPTSTFNYQPHELIDDD